MPDFRLYILTNEIERERKRGWERNRERVGQGRERDSGGGKGERLDHTNCSVAPSNFIHISKGIIT